MNLRLRILLGYGYLFALLLLSAAGAALGFEELSRAIGQVLAENFDSVEAANDMLEALERQDSATLGQLLGKEGSAPLMSQADEQFDAALEAARGNVSLEGEAGVVAEIAQHLKSYREARAGLLENPPERPLAAYERKVFPLFEKVKAKIFELIALNHEAMVEADDYARRSALRRAIFHGLLVTLALFSLGYLARETKRHVFDRIEELEEVAEAIASGEKRRRARADRSDELGAVARQLNTALDSRGELESEMCGRLAQQKQMVLALLRARGRRAAVFSLDGHRVASTLGEEETGELQRLLEDLRKADKLQAEEGGRKIQHLETEGRKLAVRLLESPDGRRVGWLAHFEDDTAENDTAEDDST